MKNRSAIIATLEVQTRGETFVAHYSNSGLARLDFPSAKKVKALPPSTPAVSRWHNLTRRAVTRALQGRPVGEIPPLDLASGTKFQRQVWEALRRIPAGRTETYAQVAAAVGRPRAARAVGGSCGANPVPLLIPCHRVVATGGGLGGFSGGLQWKMKLLALENRAAHRGQAA